MRNRYVDTERLKGKFISLDWSVNKWVNDVDISLALSHEDLEPVVRCKDCKNRNRYECDHIKLGETKCGVTDDWYCADGERKDDADE
jgi:hypothetical protein